MASVMSSDPPSSGNNSSGFTVHGCVAGGSDSGGGAGIQADIKAMSANGVYAASVITAVTAQNTHSVSAVHEIPAPIVAAQIDVVLSDLSVQSIKLGMLFSPQIIQAVHPRSARFGGPSWSIR